MGRLILGTTFLENIRNHASQDMASRQKKSWVLKDNVLETLNLEKFKYILLSCHCSLNF